MPTIYSPGQISAGTLNVAPINIGTQKSLEILNYSSYFLCLATTQAGATDKNDPSLVTVIEPWQGIRMPVPIGTANTQLYVGVDPTLSTNPVTFGNVVDLPGVQYQTFNVVVVPSRWALLGQSVVNPDGATVGTLVNNNSGNPVLNNPLNADSLMTSGISIDSGNSASATIAAVVQKIVCNVVNAGASSTGNAYLTVYPNLSTGGEVIISFNLSSLAVSAYSNPLNIDLGSGIQLSSVIFRWSDSASNPISLDYNIFYI